MAASSSIANLTTPLFSAFKLGKHVSTGRRSHADGAGSNLRLRTDALGSTRKPTAIDRSSSEVMPEGSEGIDGAAADNSKSSQKLAVLLPFWSIPTAWSRAARRSERELVASVVHEGKIWVIGGRLGDGSSTASVLTYDAEADTWGTAPPLPSPRWGSAAAAAARGDA